MAGVPVDPIDVGDISPADFVKEAVERGIFVFDLETTGLDPLNDHIEGIALYIPQVNIVDEITAYFPTEIEENGLLRSRKAQPRTGREIRAWYPFKDGTMRVRMHDPADLDKPHWYEDLRPAMDQESVIETLRPLFEEHTDVISIAHNFKFDASFLIHASGTPRGYKFRNRTADSLLLDFLGDENQKKYGLKQRVKKLLGHDMTTYDDVQRYRRQFALSFMAKDVKPLGVYAMEDTRWTFSLFETAYRRLMKEDPTGRLEKIYWDLDMEISQIVEEMESAGCNIDDEWLRKITEELEIEKNQILTRIETRLGFPLNPKSSPQVSTVLFGPREQGYLALPTKHVPFNQKSGYFATGSKEIGFLKRADPLVKDILDWRSKDTIQSSFSVKIVDIISRRSDRRLHAKFNQSGTKIFRFSCVAASTKLDTSNGSVAISDLDLSDGRIYTIETHMGRQRQIVEKIYKGRDEMYEVTLDGGQRIHCTKDHRFLTPSGWIALKRLGAGSALLVPTGVSATGSSCAERSDQGTDGRVVSANLHRLRNDSSSSNEGIRDLVPSARSESISLRGEVLRGASAASVEESLAGHAGKQARRSSVEVLHRPGRVLLDAPQSVRCDQVPLGGHKVVCNVASLLCEDREGAQESRLILNEYRRVDAVDVPSGRGDRAYKAVPVLQELAGGLRVPAVEARGGGRRSLPRDGRSDQTTRPAEGEDARGDGLLSSEIHGGRSAQRDAEGRGDHLRVARIVSVKSLGVQDVWDITVDEDHSYVAHGFVNHNSSDPINFQNQPRKKNQIRRAFVGTTPREISAIMAINSEIERLRRLDEMILMFAADYSQVELRVAAHLSGDPNMIEVYSTVGGCKADGGKPCAAYQIWECGACNKNDLPTAHFTPLEGTTPTTCPACGSDRIEHKKQCRHVDIHSRTAEDVDVERNPLAKNLNFGNLYRIGPARFCQYADLYDEAGEPMIDYSRQVIDGWYQAYPGIRPFHELTEESLRRNGWIAYTLLGRRHRLAQSRIQNEYEAITQGIQFQVSGCLAAGTPVLTDQGYVPIELLGRTGRLIFDGKSFTPNYRVYDSGVKEVFDLELDGGRRIRASSQHRFAVMSGLSLVWKTLSELAIGDVIATADQLAPGGCEDTGVTESQAYLVGALIGDGYYGASQGFVIAASAKEPGWPETLEATVVEALGSAVKSRLRWGLRQTSRGGTVRDLVVHSAAARANLTVLGLDCVSKQDKRIPSWVMTAPPDVRGAVLAGLIDTDGHVGLYKQNGYAQLTIQYSSRVEELVRAAWCIASSLGIEAHVTSHEVTSTSKTLGTVRQYRLNIGYRGFQAFHRWVRLRHPRKSACLDAGMAVIGRAPARRSLPESFVKAVADLASLSPVMVSRTGSAVASDDRTERRRVQSYIGHARKGCAGENMIREILNYIGQPGPMEVLDLGWSAVKSITPAGVEPTFDIEIDGPNHAYVAGGVLTHNSAQDIIKLAMRNIRRERERIIANAQPAARRLWQKVRFLIQVHDEVIFEGPNAIRHEIKDVIDRNMQGAVKLRVPLEASAKWGNNWDEVH